MKILIVDDSKAMRSILVRTLKQAGLGTYTVVEASNGLEAMRAIQDASPSLVLLDWNMPEMTGIEVAEKLKALGTGVKFGFVTTEVTPDMRRRALAAGAGFVIGKPFTQEDFKVALEGFI